MRDESKEQLQAAVGTAYAVERELGRGGMATVYLAEDRKHGRHVAIKVLHPELAGAIGATRFLREIEAAARLNHPHILPLHDSGVGEGLLYYVMPLVEGGSLRDRLKRETQLPLDEALRIAREVAEALDHAHARGLVHRDIKPENILLHGGHALVSDFGIARAIDTAAGETLTATGLAIGTPAYMSPEQAVGGQTPDARGDVYSLACVVYEMLAGSTPYSGATPQAVLARKLSEPVPSLRVVRETIPEAVDAVLAKALAKSPADRFPAATQFVEALEHALASPARTNARRRSVWTVAAAALPAAVLVVAAVVMLARARRASDSAVGGEARIESLAVLPLENLSGDPEQEYFVAGMHSALIGELARIGGPRVVSRTSVLRYQNSGKSIPEIARELDVDGVVEGAALQWGDSVRLQVQLIRAQPAERNVWTNRYERHLRDVLALHSEIARTLADSFWTSTAPGEVVRPAIARTLATSMAPGEGVRPGRPRVVDPRAHDAYLRGRYFWDKRDEASLQKALVHFREALDLDPTFAPGYAGLADVYAMLGAPTYHFRPPAEMYPLAKTAAERALELDSTLADAHATLGQVAGVYGWDWQRAERSFRTAIALDSGHTSARHWYSLLLATLGRLEEAEREARRARDLDPLTPVLLGNVARIAHFRRRYEDAAASYRAQLELGALGGWPRVGIAMALAEQGQYGPALATLDSVDASFGGLTESVRGYIHAAAGHPGEARRAIAELIGRSRDEYVAPFHVAILYAAVGENDRAFEWLERAERERDGSLRYVKVEPMLDPLRADPRFAALLKRMALE